MSRYWVLIGDRKIGPYPLPQIILMRRQGKLESPVELLEEGGDAPILLRQLVKELRASQPERAAALPTLDDTLSEARSPVHETPFAVGFSPVTYGLLLVNLLVFLVAGWMGAGWIEMDAQRLIDLGSNFAPATQDGQTWRLVSYMFLHGGLLHLLVNSVALFDLGRLSERLFGWRRLLLIYLTTGVAAGVASAWWNPWVNSVGASGAIFGVMGALLAFLLDRGNGIPVAVMRPHVAGLAAMAGYSLLYGFVAQGVDNAAHIGGFLAGLVWGLASGCRCIPSLRNGLAVTVIALVCIGLHLYTPNHGPTLRAEQEFQSLLQHFSQEEERLVRATQRLAPVLESKLRMGLADPDLVARLESYAKSWDALGKALGQPKLPPGHHLRDLQWALLENAHMRNEHMTLLAQAARAPESSRELAGRLRENTQRRQDSAERLKALLAKPAPTARGRYP